MAERGLEPEVIEILSLIDGKRSFLLSGGAGSGKTYSLVSILKELSKKYPKYTMACITFTNAAAIEIKNRSHINNLYVSTIHDFLWDNIQQFQNQLRTVLVDMVNNPMGTLSNPNPDTIFELNDDVKITYKEHTRLAKGEISHDEVITIAGEMFERYPKLCKVVCSKFPFIFVDEYQDTSPVVIKTLLVSLQRVNNPSVIGFFGDSMQSIYDDGVGDIEEYVNLGIVKKVEKKQNRRNPQAIMDVANRLREDGLIQEPSTDENAPNMMNGHVKKGTVTFLYGTDIKGVYSSDYLKGWDFEDSKTTKELRLTHNLIAGEANFGELMAVYDSDPILKLKKDFKEHCKKNAIEIDEGRPFGDILEENDWPYGSGPNKGKMHLEVLLSNPVNHSLYSHVKGQLYSAISRLYWDKDQLLDDKIQIDGNTIKESKRDALISHLFRIQEIIVLYQQSNIRDLLRKIGIKIQSNSDKKRIYDILEQLLSIRHKTIGEIIEYAEQKSLCIKNDAYIRFVEKNEYLYWRVSQIPYSVFEALYNYLEGRRPFSTQHRVKGLEYDNVLVILDNAGWNKYNFDYVLNASIDSSLSFTKKKSFPSVKKRTKKLLYVCCTRAKENLVVYYPEPSSGVLEGAKKLFGTKNCIDLSRPLSC